MNNLNRAARVRAERRVKTVAERIGEKLSLDLPHRLRVESAADHVAISGPGLRAEWLRNPDLRAVGYLLRGMK
jgi:hypothetical protein